MIKAEDTALILLAAGKSVRFGDKDKLEQDYLGEPLAFHVVTALEAIPFKRQIAVVSGTKLDFASRGYKIVCNEAPGAGLASSIKLGIAEARGCDPQAVLIALADMPRVTAAHIYRMLDYGEDDDCILASSDGVRPRPPALFGRNHFDWLMTLTGDKGARDMIAKAHHMIAVANELMDIDTPEDLERLRALV